MEKHDFIKIFRPFLDYFPGKVSSKRIEKYFEAVAQFPKEVLSDALEWWTMEKTHLPSPSELKRVVEIHYTGQLDTFRRPPKHEIERIGTWQELDQLLPPRDSKEYEILLKFVKRGHQISQMGSSSIALSLEERQFAQKVFNKTRRIGFFPLGFDGKRIVFGKVMTQEEVDEWYRRKSNEDIF